MKIFKVSFYKFFLVSLIVSLFNSCTEIDMDKTAKVEIIKPVDLVYPLLDTENSRWFFFASANRPFGMVNLSPDTQLKGTWGSGYRHEIDTIKGFSHIHGWQLSGLSVMPVVLNKENQKSIFKDFYSKFSHKEEEVSPGYHSLQLQRYGIKTELTSTKRVGMHRYKFQNGTENAILFNLNGQLGPCKTSNGKLEQISDTEFTGVFVIEPTSRKPKSNQVFFHISLNTKVKSIEQDSETGNYILILKDNKKEVLMKVSISYTSALNAKTNMNAELYHWNFEQVVQESKNEWNELLARIKIDGGTEKAQRRFYTDLWHALQGRHTISDVNGSYPDNTGSTFRVGKLPLNVDGTPKFNHYNSDSFWGAQWTINTLWGLVYPEIKKEFVQSLIQYENDGGLIPRGPSGGNYTFVMTGASSTPFIISAIQQGLITEDLDTTYQKLKKNHMPGGIMEKAGYEHNTNKGGGLKYYLEKGFVPYPLPEGKFGGHQDGASLTMEYAYQDFVLAQLAKKLGYDNDYYYFSQRSLNYKNVYDLESGWMRPKNVAGVWRQDFDPYLYENGFNESNGAQSTWFVPHDINGLAELMGGKEKAVERLDTQFKEAKKQGFTAGKSHDREMHPELSRIPINYGNQPSMQTAFIFNQLDRPDLTQYWSRQVINKVFSGLDPTTGYNGDEDQGLMGSLAVLMKMGIFQLNGGVGENPKYSIGSPVFDSITITLNQDFYPGKEIKIKTLNNSSENVYINKSLWNNISLDSNFLNHNDIVNGGILELHMTPERTHN